MSRLLQIVFCSSVLVFTAALAAQQEKKEEYQYPQPVAEHLELKKAEGTWDTVMKMPDGKSSKGVATYKMECGGLWLVSDLKGEFEGLPFHGKGLDSYDAAKKTYVSIWVDSMITTPLIMEGTRDKATKTTTQTGECPGPDGKLVKMKGVSKDIDDNHLTFEMYMIGADGKEAKQFSIDYTRRK